MDIVDLIARNAALFTSHSPGIHIDDLPEKIILCADPKQVKTVLKNIFTNALKYSEKEGPPINVSVTKQPNQVEIAISDSGDGIPNEELSHIFESFYRVDKSRSKQTGGYGLGLSLCKTIMDAHSGKIHVNSTEGIGTTVTLVFPDVDGIA